MSIRSLLAICVLLCIVRPGWAQSLDELKVGHWVELDGEFSADGTFHASALVVRQETNSALFVGKVSAVDLGKRRFTILGKTIRVTDKSKFEGPALEQLEGQRVWADSRWHGGANFSAHLVKPDTTGRDSIGGRIDALERTPGGLELKLLGITALLPAEVKPANSGSLEQVPLAPETAHNPTSSGAGEREDFIPGKVHILDTLTIGALFEYDNKRERDYDLARDIGGDRTRQYLLIKSQLDWRPTDSFHARLLEQYELADLNRSDGSTSESAKPQLDEAWVNWKDLWNTPLDVRIGRQKFVDEREWIYRSYLDAARFTWNQPGVRLELSASTVLFGGSGRDVRTENYMAYLSNNNREHELAAWIVDRRQYEDTRDLPIHFGLRAYGDWIPQNRMWADASLLRGYTGTENLKGWAFDVGTTWSPPAVAPFSFTVGLAEGSGDDPGTTTVDESFRQTGLQRNKDKWAGVSNFKYYGELLDPELSNLSIATLGIGARISPTTSIDLVWHSYRQLETQGTLLNTNLVVNPSGLDPDLGREFDFILGFKARTGWDVELIYGRFTPGHAFPGADSASLGSILLRYRF